MVPPMKMRAGAGEMVGEVPASGRVVEPGAVDQDPVVKSEKRVTQPVSPG